MLKSEILLQLGNKYKNFNPEDIESIFDLFIKKITNSLSPEYKILFKFNSEKILINRYKREYFISKNKKIRITLDKNIQIYDQRFALKKPNLKLKNYTQNYLVMEFKFNKEDKKFINDLDINIPIKVSRNSKYINGIRSVVGR